MKRELISFAIVTTIGGSMILGATPTQSQGYNPSLNPGYGRRDPNSNNNSDAYNPGLANRTNYYNTPTKNYNALPQRVATSTTEAMQIVTSNFPLPPASDEAAQFCVPMLAKMAAGGPRKRQFRAVQ
jgi:hypothetical protein